MDGLGINYALGAKLLELNIKIYGIKALVNTSVADFADFVSKNYGVFISTKHETEYDVEIFYSKKAGRKARSFKNNMTRIGEDIFIGEKQIFWENEFGFCIIVDVRNREKWVINASHDGLLNKTSLEDRYENFQRSIRWAVHFPIFCLLERNQEKELIHASAVAKDGHALLFCGLNKVGKSSLTMFLVKNYNYKFMSDNFLLIGKNEIFAFPEVLRLSPEGLKNLGLNLRYGNTVYGKYHIVIQKSDVWMSAIPTHAFNLCTGKENSIAPLKRQIALKWIQANHDFLQEFQGGGLVRSAGSKKAGLLGRRTEEREKGDERILGSGDFVTNILADSEQTEGYKSLRRVSLDELNWL